MASSAYYWGEMLRLRRKIDNQKEKLSKYKEFLAKLKKLYGEFSPVISQMRGAESSFANGGYLSGGKTLTQGKLLTQATHLSKVQDNVQNLIDATELEIENINTKISALEASHQSAENSYYAAKAEEEAASKK